MPISYKSFVEQVIERAFPEGEPENLIKPHRQDITARLIKLQEACRLYRENHTDIYPFCSTYFWCGATVIEAPVGKIKRLYTLPEDQDCCPVFYEYVAEYDTFIDWLFATRPNFVKPNESDKLENSGFTYSNESQNKGIRYSYGKYTINSGKIYIGQRIESTERVVVEWSGVKRKWKDDDLVGLNLFTEDNDEITDLIIMVADYVLGTHLVTYIPTMAEHGMLLINKSDSELAELIWKVNKLEQPEIVPDKKFGNVSIYTPEIKKSNKPIEQNKPTEQNLDNYKDQYFVCVSDLQSSLQDVTKVANYVKSLIPNPDFIILNGDLWLDSATGNPTMQQLDDNIGPNYSQFIYPYKGTKGISQSKIQNAYITLGNHDVNPPARKSIVLDYFNVPKPTYNSEKVTGYYAIERNGVLLAFIDSTNVSNCDTNSEQYNIMSSIIRNSKMKWKILFSHYPPYSSVTYDFNAPVWDYKKLGIDIVVSGHIHYYEKLLIDGVYFFIAGTGANPTHTTTNKRTGSYGIITKTPGFLYFKSSYTENTNTYFLVVEFTDVNGMQQDYTTISKLGKK